MDPNLATNLGLLAVTAIATGSALRSNSHARESAAEAARSTKAAEAALELSRSERDRAIERGDVYFKRSPRHENGVYTFTNTGTSDAYDVAVLALINDETLAFSVELVKSGESFQLDGSTHLAEAIADRDRRQERGSAPGVIFGAMVYFDVSGRISWQSELGTPGIQAFSTDDP